MLINMDACLLDKLLILCHVGPSDSWRNLVISEKGESNQGEIIENRSAVWPSCKVGFLCECTGAETVAELNAHNKDPE